MSSAPPGFDWVVDSWQAEAGLPHSAVTAVVQTWDGYLWIGTANGLARFDGVRFTTYRSPDTPGLRSNRILCLYEDAYGTLWIGTDGGGLSSHHAGVFRAIGTPEGLSSDTVLCLGEDDGGRLWAGTDSGLNLHEADRLTTFFKTDGLPDDRVSAISRPAGRPLIVSTGHGLCQYRRETLTAFSSSLSTVARTNLSFLHQDRSGNFWAGGEGGLFRVPTPDGNGHGPAQPVHDAPVTSFAECKQSGFWVGAADGGLWRVDARGGLPEKTMAWQSSQPITALWEDREGNLWAGTAGEGLHRVKKRQLRLIPWPDTRNPPRIFPGPTGELRLLGTTNQVFDLRECAFAPSEQLALPVGVEIRTVCQAQPGEFWVGTVRDGLFQCGPAQWKQFSERAGISDSAIELLALDGADGIWIGTRNGGLNHFHDSEVTRFNTPWGFQDTCASTLERGRHGDLWIGTTGDGLFRLRDGSFSSFNTSSGLPGNVIHALHADRSAVLWVGTDKGLARVQDGKVASFAKPNGLPEEAILQLDSDAAGNLWVGAANRIFRVSKEQLDRFARSRVPLVTAVTYGKEDGLPGIQCLPRIQSRGGGIEPGDISFATSRGLVIVKPDTDLLNREPPPVVLEGMFVNNVSTSTADGLRVASGRTSLRFEFTALSLTAPGKVQFRYRLQGLDPEWSEPAVAREARYPQVPPGDYTFQVIACNNDGLWNETGAQATITVLPFWWETAWFRTVVILAVAGTGGALYQMRRVRRREIERLRLRIASDLHDDIGSSLWSITLLSRMLTKHGNLAAEERQDIEEINRIAVQTSNSIRDIIWLINPAFDTLQDLVSRTQDFAGTVLRGVEYRITCDPALLGQKLPFDFRHHLFLFFKEAITNIGRHASASLVEVRIDQAVRDWRINVRDNGCGFHPDATVSGHGLRNLRNRAARMKAVLAVESAPGQGTTLTLSSLRNPLKASAASALAPLSEPPRFSRPPGPSTPAEACSPGSESKQ